jgi:hypothetical protein
MQSAIQDLRPDNKLITDTLNIHWDHVKFEIEALGKRGENYTHFRPRKTGAREVKGAQYPCYATQGLWGVDGRKQVYLLRPKTNP